MDTELSCRIWLGSIQALGSRHRRMLHAYFKSCQEIYRAKRSDLIQALAASRKAPEELADAILRAKTQTGLDQIISKVESIGCKVCAEYDEEYPPLLRLLGADAPFFLYCIGEASINQEKTIGIVGTRKNSRYGAEIAYKMAKELAQAGVCVISGMAEGIDGHAHRGAIEGKGVTIAVLGCGVDIAYPRTNAALYEQIAKNGAIVSEYFPGTKPLAFHFPQRNRIISGMSSGVLLVECPEHSGAMITARLCVEQGRDLFVVPGNVTSPQAEGSNELLIGGACAVLNALDILNRFDWVPTFTERAQESPAFELSKLDRIICDKLQLGELHLEELANLCSLRAVELLSHLTLMEIRGIIKQLPGQLFALVRR